MLRRPLLPCKAWSSHFRCLKNSRLAPRLVSEVARERPFEFVKEEGRGLSARAKRDLSLGDVVLIEQPVLAVENNGKGDEWKEDLHSRYEALSEERQSQVWNLHDACLQKPEKSLEGILFTNCIGRNLPVRFDAALFLELSRFNHSCSPNLEQTWNADTGEVRLVAAEPVKAGEELCTHYVELRLDRAERRQRCECPACAQPSEESDKRRTEIKRLAESIEKDRQDRLKNMERGERSVKRVLKLLDKEGLHLLSWRKTHCLAGMEFALRQGDLAKSIQWARKGHQYARLAHGPDHRDTKMLLQLMEDPSSHPDFQFRTDEMKDWTAYVVVMSIAFVVFTVLYI
ncbi:unnamed protein product [Durusdinium trenchii]|uniref:Uncharacterized protein n=2 Tax=Durusdinium trenchii TaxID=1381693 RepID=A0ABP0LDR2_9DINO